jgi:hypothetical protein
MPRIFTSLVLLDAVFLIVSYALGCTSKLRDGVNNPEERIYWYHFLAGLTTNVLTLLVHCLIFTYFLGTGRWVKEVKIAYDLPDEPLPKLTRELKRRVFPPALYAMLWAIATGAAGAAAHVKFWPWYVHFTVATVTLLVNFWAFRIEYACLKQNVTVLHEVLVAVDEIRAARGLPSNEVALQMEDTV